MRRILITLATTMLAVSSCLAVGADTSAVDLAEKAKFYAEHPAVGRIRDARSLNHYPMIQFRDTQLPEKRNKPSLRSSAALPVIWANMIYSDSWTGRYEGYGVYDFQPSSTPTFNLLKLGDSKSMKANGGGVKIDNRYHAIYWGYGYGSISTTYYIYDTDTWELLDYYSTGSPGTCATNLAYDRINNVCYGAFFRDDLTGYELGTIDFSGVYPAKTTIGSIPLMVVALGVNSQGEVYGICEDGVLYKFDTTTGAMTSIGDTGIKVASNAGITQQSGAFDQHTDIFYWAANDVYGTYALYTVDVNTAKVTKIADLTDHEQLLNLQVMEPAAADAAPNYISNLSATFEGASLTGSVSFDVADCTYDGTPITEDLTYYVAVNGEVKTTGSVAAGSSVNATVTADGGDSLIEAWVSNEAGESPHSNISLWIGEDVPYLKSVNYEANGRTSTITWKVAEKGTHNGSLGDLSFKIDRYPDGVTVVEAATGNSYTDELPEDAPLAKYYYTITPKNAGLEGEPMSTNSNMVGSALEVPYSQTFDDESSMDMMEVVDGNLDGISWIWGEQSYFNTNGVAVWKDDWCGSGHVADDWLLTPELHFEKGKTYQVYFKCKSTAYAKYNDRLAVAYGVGLDPAQYETIMPETQFSYSNAFSEFSIEVNSTADQKVHVGFHRVADSISDNMQIDDIIITALGSADAPGASTNMVVTPDPLGELTAKVSFTAPTETKGGDVLTSITSAEVYAGTDLVYTFGELTPGENYECEVSLSANASYQFRVECSNEEGSGLPATVTEYVGVDVPGAISPKAYDNESYITLSWEAPTTGLNGYYVNPDKITYDVYTTDGAFSSTLIVSDVKGTSVNFEYDTESGSQGGLLFAVRPKNAAGDGRLYQSNTLIVGESYTLPYEEHFLGDSGYSYDYESDNYAFGLGTGMASDGDNASMIWVSMFDDAEYVEFSSLKIALGEDLSPRMSFDYRMGEDNTLDVYILKPDGSETLVKTITEQAGSTWLSTNIDLNEFKSERYIRFKIRYNKNGNDEIYMGVDNLRIIDAISNNLAITSLSLPSTSTKYNENIDINVTVLNKGYETASDYQVRLYADDELVDEKAGTELVFGSDTTFHFTYEVKTGSAESISMKAEVVYAADERQEDNVINAVLSVQMPKVSAPINLTGHEDAGVELKWEAPTEFYSEDVYEDFESYAAWTITNIGNWTLYDGDQAEVVTFENLDYLNAGKAQAFTIFNPSNLGVSSRASNPRSGEQFLACLAADITQAENNDDWIISPLLPGIAQRVSFYAKEYSSVYSSEQLQVLYSTTGTDVDDFELLSEFTLTNYNLWKHCTVDLPEGALYFAFRVVTRDGYVCMIDDVEFTAGSCRDIKSYRVYRDSERIGEVDSANPTFSDPEGDKTHTYNVTAVYATGEESNFSLPADFSESGLDQVAEESTRYTVYSVDGKVLRHNASTVGTLEPGVYIINGKKTLIRK